MYNYIKSKGGWLFSNSDTIVFQGATMPFDSVFFKTSVAPNNVDTAKMRWDSELGTVVLGMYDKVPNELGFKNFWLVKNQTGSTITKGSIVYANGTVGASGRITVAKFIANGTIDSKYLLGITAHDLSNGEDGYVISFGKIRKVNTDTFSAGAILYPSPTVAGVWTDVEPIAPNLDMPIGFCINSSSNNGTIAIRVASGYKLNELHDVAISSPVDRGSLYYRGGLWRDTTTALLTSDTSSMLTNYLRSGVAASTYVPLNTESTMNATLNINGNLTLLTGGILTTPLLSAGTIIKQGGTTSQFLKANGDIDSTNYLSSSSAASTYLPLAGGTLTGTLNGINQNLNSNLSLTDPIAGNAPRIYTSVTTGPSSTASIRLALDQATSGGANMFMGGSQLVGGSATNPNIFFTDSRRAYASIGGIYSGAGTLISGHIIFNTTPNDGTTALTERMRISQDGSITMGGTLGVTGATTLYNLAGSGTRMVTASSTGLLSTQTIPTGTVASVTGSSPISSSGGTTPNISMTAAGVNVSGYVTHDGTQIFTGNKSFLGQTTMTGIAFFKDYTYQATRLAGLSSTDRFATVTLGTGLSLSGGVLSATSGGVTSVTASTPLSSSGGATPNITIANASTSASGVVTTGTQSFAGNKTFTGNVIISGASTLTVGSSGTFGGRVNTPWLERTYTNTTSSSFTVSINTTWLDINTSVLTTLTLPNAATYPGKELHIRQTGGGSLQSASPNIIPFQVPPTGSTSTGILTASTHRAVTLVSDGVNWIIMQRSEI
jgi:hypothetical protein